jgi:hypothetical protein
MCFFLYLEKVLLYTSCVRELSLSARFFFNLHYLLKKIRWDTNDSSLFCHSTKKSDKSPLSTIAIIILHSASIITTNNRGDKESPCLNLRELLKNLDVNH